jgi:AcrR family transcriptional regulator
MEGSSKKQRTHERIVREASRLVRERGAEAMGVDHVMDAVGLTRGGFYAHFDSKSALVTRAVEAAFEEALVRLFSGDQRDGGRRVARSRHPALPLASARRAAWISGVDRARSRDRSRFRGDFAHRRAER